MGSIDDRVALPEDPRDFHSASPARTALPAAHFDRNATIPVTDLVHQR
jgi:hypothetical protein